MEFPEEIVVEVRREKTEHDPPINVYMVKTMFGDKGIWEETFGSKEKLDGYLRGVESTLNQMGVQTLLLEWNIPDSWTNPSGRRWNLTLTDGSRYEESYYDIDSSGLRISI